MIGSDRRALLAGLIGALAASAAAADPLARRFGGPFTLTSHRGERVSDESFRGRFMLIYFGFTDCTDLCPIDVPSMMHALEALGPAAERVQPLFITVDPDTDTPAKLAGYVESFGPRLTGLTGSGEEIAAVTRAYRVHRMRIVHRPDQAAVLHRQHTVDHGSLTYLMGPDGGFLTMFPHDTRAERMAEVLRRYVG